MFWKSCKSDLIQLWRFDLINISTSREFLELYRRNFRNIIGKYYRGKGKILRFLSIINIPFVK